jgi:hypothetical protein
MKKAIKSDPDLSKKTSKNTSKIEDHFPIISKDENNKTKNETNDRTGEIVNFKFDDKESFESSHNDDVKMEFGFQRIKVNPDTYIFHETVTNSTNNEMFKFQENEKPLNKDNTPVQPSNEQDLTQFLQMNTQNVNKHIEDKQGTKDPQDKNSVVSETDKTTENDVEEESDETEEEDDSEDDTNSKKEVDIGTSLSINKKNLEAVVEEKNTDRMLMEFYWKEYPDVEGHTVLNYVTGKAY